MIPVFFPVPHAEYTEYTEYTDSAFPEQIHRDTNLYSLESPNKNEPARINQ